MPRVCCPLRLEPRQLRLLCRRQHCVNLRFDFCHLRGPLRGQRCIRLRNLRDHIGDRGPGVPESDLERIFQPFQRVAESRDRATGGEGIGLAITSQVMKTHGGTATASAPAGGGLAVRLVLPPVAVVV